jgi:hypothetical protein
VRVAAEYLNHAYQNVRRKFFDFQTANDSPIAREALDRIRVLYGFEAKLPEQAAR